jgi:hypothetical protein
VKLIGLIIPVYLVGMIITAWVLTLARVDSMAKEEIRRRRRHPSLYRDCSDPLVTDEERSGAFTGSLIISIIWPPIAICILIVLPFKLLIGFAASRLISPSEQAHAAELRVRRLRRQAEELGLPLGDTDGP